jgi:hypothetical protein
MVAPSLSSGVVPRLEHRRQFTCSQNGVSEVALQVPRRALQGTDEVFRNVPEAKGFVTRPVLSCAYNKRGIQQAATDIGNICRYTLGKILANVACEAGPAHAEDSPTNEHGK